MMMDQIQENLDQIERNLFKDQLYEEGEKKLITVRSSF